MTAKPELKLEDFPNRTYGKTRRGAAAENHVNNVVYPDFYDTGLTAIAHDPVLLEGGKRASRKPQNVANRTFARVKIGQIRKNADRSPTDGYSMLLSPDVWKER